MNKAALLLAMVLITPGVFLAPGGRAVARPVGPEQAASRPTRDVLETGRPAVRTFTDADGLPSNSIEALCFDREGRVWAGTEDGPAVYDGRAWRAIPMPERIGTRFIRAIITAADGSLWVGTDGAGLLRLANDEWTVIAPTPGGLPNGAVRCLLETTEPDGNGGPPRRTLWVGTDGGLGSLRDGQWTVYGARPEGDLPSKQVLSLAVDTSSGRNILWVGTYGGLARLDRGEWTVYDARSGDLPNDIVRSLCVSATGDGSVWVGTEGGVARLAGGAWTHYDKSLLPNGVVSALVESADGRGSSSLLVGTFGGLARFREGRWETLPLGPRDTGKHVIKGMVLNPRSENRPAVWIGLEGVGVVRMEDRPWVCFDTTPGVPRERLLAFYETADTAGAPVMWVAGDGLAKFERGAWTTQERWAGSTVKTVVAFASLPGARDFWIGSYDKGLAHVEDGRWTYYDTSNGLPSNTVWSLLETTTDDGTRTLWAGTYGAGLARLERGNWTVYDSGSDNGGTGSLPNNWVTALAETRDADGTRTVWAGTRAGGLARLRHGRWTTLDMTSGWETGGLPSNTVWSLHVSRAGNGAETLWVGTAGGVAKFDPRAERPRVAVITESTDPALPNNVVCKICEGPGGRIYVTTYKGLVRLTPRTPTVDDPREYDLYTYTVEDGLPSNECWACFVDSAGRVWAGTVRGVAVLDPANEYLDTHPKSLLIERAVASNRAGLSPDRPLAYNENDVSFEFALLSYFKESQTQFRSQLVGWEDAPSEWTRDAKKGYTNLPPGDYTFQVWGRDYAGNVSGPTAVGFTIRPAPWQTWWAYLLYVLVAGALLVAFVRLRLRALQRRAAMLEAKVVQRTAELGESERRALEANRAKSVFLANMSHELRTPLNAVIGFSQLMRRSSTMTATDRENLAIIERSGEHLLGLINDVLSLSKIEAGKITLSESPFDLRRMLRSVQEMVGGRAEAAGLDLVVDLDETLPAAVGGDEQKLRQVLVNLLGNAVKFTRRGTVTLRARWSDGRAYFTVEDTGVGIGEREIGKLFEAFVQTESGLTAKEGTGLGLVISRQIVRMMGGDIAVRSRIGEGTTFSFDVASPLAAGIESQRRQRPVVGLVRSEQTPSRILVVDDTLENRVLLVKLLTSVGFEVREASDGAQAVEAWEAWRPDLIFMDMRMPVMDGMEATRRIREAELRGPSSSVPGPLPPETVGEGQRTKDKGQRTRIIALTASAFEHERETILSGGADDFVTKPFREETLFEKLAEHLGCRFQYDEVAESEVIVGGAGEPGGLSPERVAALPDTQQQALYDALANGDFEAAAEVAEQIGEHDEPVGSALLASIRGFRINELMSLLEAARPAT
jgi:signal transduction histidine kinase/CheY-like chemotaxis protein/ligand-binding sensor domain-containing protein